LKKYVWSRSFFPIVDNLRLTDALCDDPETNSQVEARLARERAEMNHRVSNSLSLAASLLRLQRSRYADEHVVEALDSAIARIEAIARVHRFLCSGTGDERHVQFGTYLKQLTGEISASTGLQCELEPCDVQVSADLAHKLAVALNELVLNACKHAFDDCADGHLRITCAARGRRLSLSVSDNGKGLPQGFSPDATNGLGLRVVQSIVQELGGELAVENGQGAKFTLSIPLP
jgi:two-component system, sensor histidine kinase PdtaS